MLVQIEHVSVWFLEQRIRTKQFRVELSMDGAGGRIP
jgi:hypothetical protein